MAPKSKIDIPRFLVWSSLVRIKTFRLNQKPLSFGTGRPIHMVWILMIHMIWSMIWCISYGPYLIVALTWSICYEKWTGISIKTRLLKIPWTTKVKMVLTYLSYTPISNFWYALMILKILMYQEVALHVKYRRKVWFNDKICHWDQRSEDTI